MIAYYTPPAVTAPAPITAPTVTSLPLEIPAAPVVHAQAKQRVLAAVPVVKTAEHGTEKGRPPQSWLQASGFPSGVLAADNQWHPNKWVGGGKAPLYKAVEAITGLPVSLGVGVAGDTKVHWLMQSRLTCLYRVAQESGVVIEIMPHTVRIVSG
ncbi:hypothetical protein [Acidithiobacillus ferridurans]|uniref:hypothetical protein n=1 Tax=Acidithiobacillus ferridurans TaxID=1232575 RepID=UPI001C076BED|nr:hypothetical protein [Acidithiobacillus ferridurans]MBU2733477.1 hypothetical protein [Acidithiobacillus ferridurans]